MSSLPLLCPTLLLPHISFFNPVEEWLKLLYKCSSSPNVDSEHKSSSPAGISTYRWSAGIGALGFVETGYLTYLKFTNSVAFCPVSGGSCSDILNSNYAVVFGGCPDKRRPQPTPPPPSRQSERVTKPNRRYRDVV